MKQYLIAFLIGVGLVACMLVMFLIGKERGYGMGYSDAMNQPHKADTVWKETPVYIDRPVEIVKWKDREKLVYVPYKVDSLIHDTTFVSLPREYKQYGDDRYEAVVSGIDPVLESIKIQQKTAYITNTVVEKKRWSFGVHVGPGVFWPGQGSQVQFGLGAVAGFGYNF